MTEMDAQRAHLGTMPVHEGLPQSAMPTQSPEPLAVKTDIIPDYYPMVPKSAVNSSQQSFYNPNFSAINPPFQSPAMSQTTMWASPRSSVDDFDNYSYRAPAPTSGYHAGSLSPRTWPDSVQTPPPQYEVPFHHQEQYDGITSDHMTMTPDTLRGSSMNISIDYGNGCFQPPLSGPHDPFPSKYDSPPPMNTACGPFVTSPTSYQEPVKPENHPSMSPSPCPSATPGGIASGSVDVEKDDSDKKKSDEPYAQLIWRALKEQESRSMTLQELYQWFLANTDKPEKAGGNGWHNSIRHNLSMNKAFLRIEVVPRHSINGSSTEKNPSKWHLDPKFEDGVKSTTHYRPGPRGPSGARRNNGNQRRSYHSSPEFPDRIIPGRAISGRKGGRATSRSRNAARDLRIRTNLQEQQHWNPLPPPPAAAAASAQRSLSASQLESSYPTYFNQHQHSQNAQRFLRAHGTQREEAARAGGIQGIQGIPIRSAGPAVPPQQPYQAPGYTMANVAGVYQHPHPQQPQQQFQQQQPRPGQQSEEVLYSGWSTSTANQGM